MIVFFFNVNDTFFFTISAVVANTFTAIVVVVVVVVWLLMSHICEALLLLMAIRRSLNTQKKRNETKTNVNHDFWSLFANNRIRKLQWAQIMRWTNLTHSFELRCMCFFPYKLHLKVRMCGRNNVLTWKKNYMYMIYTVYPLNAPLISILSLLHA